MKILGVFAKQPILGQVKTRLAAATSPAWAQRVAQALLEDTLERVCQVQAWRTLVYAPSSAAAFFEPLAQGRCDLMPQGDGDLGQRLQQFFTHARRQGFARIIAVGADSPTLPIAWIEQAFEQLEASDVVIGPALDGGYYLIGAGTKEFSVFDGIPWSTARVLETTIERVEQASARLALLPPWYDVDTADDWALLRGHVKAMRRAGVDPGVPRIERLIFSVERQ